MSSLMRSLVVELLEKIVKLGLQLQTVHARGTSGFGFERERYASSHRVTAWERVNPEGAPLAHYSVVGF